jgi:hypothetical protein
MSPTSGYCHVIQKCILGEFTMILSLLFMSQRDVHYVTVEQDPGQSPEMCVSACANEGKPRFIH